MPDQPARLLAQVRQALVCGNFQALGTLVPQIEASVSGPQEQTADLASLRAEAERTHACLAAALSGIRAARRRIHEVAEAGRGLTTYDRDGAKAILPTGNPVSRRV